MEVEEGDFAIEEVSEAEITTYVFITSFHESWIFYIYLIVFQEKSISFTYRVSHIEMHKVNWL